MTTTDATYRKEICYDRETRDYAMRLDGELVGYARSYSEAEITLDQLVFELLSHGATATASALDGDCATCAGEGDCPDCDSLIGCEVITCTQPATHFSASGAMSALCCACFVTAFGEPCGCACFVTAFGEPCGCASVAIDATARLEEADAIVGRLYCPNCLGNHLLQDCPLKRGDHTTEADTLLNQLANHPGPNCYCPACMRAAERLIVFQCSLRAE